MSDKKKRKGFSWQQKIGALVAGAGTIAGGFWGLWWWNRPPVMEVIDVTAKAAGAKYRSGNLKRLRKRKNPARDLKGITLHQTATRGVGTKAWPKMTAHYGVQKDGRIYRIHPPEVYLYAANALNGRTVSIEVAGLFGKQDLPKLQAIGLQQAIKLAKTDAAKIGATLKFIYGHRQATKGKPFGPQRSIWQNGGVWANDHGVLETEPDRTFGTGRKIPQSWLIPDGAGDEAVATFAAAFGPDLDVDQLGTGTPPEGHDDDDDTHGTPGENPEQ